MVSSEHAPPSTEPGARHQRATPTDRGASADRGAEASTNLTTRDRADIGTGRGSDNPTRQGAPTSQLRPLGGSSARGLPPNIGWPASRLSELPQDARKVGATTAG